MTNSQDQRVRLEAFQYLEILSLEHGDVLPYWPLHEGFKFDGIRVPLLGPKGIFKPRILDLPLSITTAPSSPYDDSFSSDGLLHYKYMGTDPEHRDNVGLREAMKLRVPLIYLHGVIKGRYVVAWPVFIVKDDPKSLTFTVAVMKKARLTFLTALKYKTTRRQFVADIQQQPFW